MTSEIQEKILRNMAESMDGLTISESREIIKSFSEQFENTIGILPFNIVLGYNNEQKQKKRACSKV